MKSWNHFLLFLRSNWQHQYHSLVWAHSPGSFLGNGRQAAGLGQGSVQAMQDHHSTQGSSVCRPVSDTPAPATASAAGGAAAVQQAQQGYITSKYSKEIIQLSYLVKIPNCSYNINSSTQQIKLKYILCSDSRLALMADCLQVQQVFLL